MDETNTTADWILAGNEIAQDWYALITHQASPNQSLMDRVVGTDLGGLGGVAARRADYTPLLLMVGLGVLLFIALRR